jgi:hypothetical protein
VETTWVTWLDLQIGGSTRELKLPHNCPSAEATASVKGGVSRRGFRSGPLTVRRSEGYSRTVAGARDHQNRLLRKPQENFALMETLTAVLVRCRP